MIWWPDITSNENSVITISIEIGFWKHFILTPACLKCSVMPRHNCLSRPRPNCERRCSIRHSSIEGYQLGKCFQKTPRCLLTLAPGDCLMSFLWLLSSSGSSLNSCEVYKPQWGPWGMYLVDPPPIKIQLFLAQRSDNGPLGQANLKSLTLVNYKLVSKLWWVSQHVLGLSPQTSNKHY